MQHFTRTPNRILKAMPHLSGAGLKIALAIACQTFGRGRRKARISFSLFRRMTGLSTSPIQDGLANLAACPVQCIDREQAGNSYEYWIVAPECGYVDNERPAAAASPQNETLCSPQASDRKAATLKELTLREGKGNRWLEQTLITISSAAAESGEAPLENVGWLARRAAQLGMGDGDLWCLWESCRKARRPLGLLLWALAGDGRVMRGEAQGGAGKRNGGAYARSRTHREFLAEMRA